LLFNAKKELFTFINTGTLIMQQQASQNLKALQNNPYPGRGIVLGMNAAGTHLVQIYWIMGRSENSRNRIFVQSGEHMRTKAFDESKLQDPSLIIYHPARTLGSAHIITNGDQTDTIFEALQQGGSFAEALYSREFEPDAPNYTPRISGIMQKESPIAYELSILKTQNNDENNGCLRHFFRYDQALKGLGHCITTYNGDGDPLPSFAGEPYILPLPSTPQECCDLYWESLNAENKVSLLVKFIEINTFSAESLILNRHG
jgi:IMP cyclohydrolase